MTHNFFSLKLTALLNFVKKNAKFRRKIQILYLNSYSLWLKVFEPAHEIMVLSVLCKLILQMRMRSHPVGLDVWFLVRPFIYFHTSCVRTAKALARLRGCAGSPETSLVAYVISTIFSWAGSFQKVFETVQQVLDFVKNYYDYFSFEVDWFKYPWKRKFIWNYIKPHFFGNFVAVWFHLIKLSVTWGYYFAIYSFHFNNNIGY